MNLTRWTPYEDERMLKLHSTLHFKIKDIARELDRTYTAVRARLRRLKKAMKEGRLEFDGQHLRDQEQRNE